MRHRLNSKYPASTLKNARLKRDEAAHLVALGQSPTQKKQQEKVTGPEDFTVAEFAERFFKDIQSPYIGKKPIKDVTAEDVLHIWL
ncbi:Arm DNA-binding domain-containing protein [Azomonas macrocytogenes]|uniref:Integrase DNA-binding domain-containing protein n=1 Tax=Azomonas macrocytogenes TaxID=69962 RepID=A0A839T0T2_AZOMA|nr:Arm DNA-binding domain-containing protein [Azomonas macrocytogenes]MBB3102992.1 hypothetical protein [Azomonas macrocytogenes]